MSITLSVAQYISGKIRQGYHDGNLTDYNSGNRTGTNFVYPDKPKLTSLLKNKNNFPRISIESMDTSHIGRLGMQSTQYKEKVQLSINIYSVPNLTCQIHNVASEDHTYNTGTDYYELNDLPVSILGNAIDGTAGGLPYSFTKGTDYELVDNDYDGINDGVSWIGDTPDDGTNFTCAYNRKASSDELVRVMGNDITNYIKNNWQSWFNEDKFINYFNITSSRPIKLDEYEQINRYEIFCIFTGIDINNY